MYAEKWLLTTFLTNWPFKLALRIWQVPAQFPRAFSVVVFLKPRCVIDPSSVGAFFTEPETYSLRSNEISLSLNVEHC